MLSVHFHPFCITESFLEFHSFITWCTSHVHVFFLCSLHHLPLHFTLTRETFLIRQFAPQKTVTCAKNFGIGALRGEASKFSRVRNAFHFAPFFFNFLNRKSPRVVIFYEKYTYLIRLF